MLRKRMTLLTIALVALVALVAGCGSKSGSVTVGSKDFTESILLGEITAQLVEKNTDLKVIRKLNLGGTTVTFDGLKNDDLTMYAEYDGTGYSNHLGHKEPITDPSKVYDQVKREFEEKWKITWSKPFGFNNTYALAMPRTVAEQYHIKTYSDLAQHSDKFVFGTTQEFMGREVDGYNPLVKTYGFKFKDVKQMTAGLRYKAVQANEIQVMDAYATDGMLKEFGMVILQDDKKFFPPYNGAVVVRMDSLEKHPELKDLLDKLGGTMTDEVVQDLNYRVDVKGDSVETVATDFLKSKGLIK